jgi:hypothetical protein
MIDTEIMVKLARKGSMIIEVGVTHLPRTAGTARGAKPAVILRALREVWRMYPQLSRLDSGGPPLFSDPVVDTGQPIGLSRQEAAV